jgi:spore coat protein U-like protein
MNVARVLVAVLVAVVMLLARASPARAQACAVAATGLGFGVYNTGTATPNDTTGTVTVTCSSLSSIAVSYTIALSPGPGGSVAARSMTAAGVSPLAYQIYTDTMRTRIWGDGTAGSFNVGDAYTLPAILPVIRQYTGYGRMPARQLVSPGIFGDTVSVMITY